MAWRVARSLDTLLAQLNAVAPRRSKVSDGSIGDAAHASRSSDHNPWVKSGSTGIVTARDYTHDPAGGLDCNWLAQKLVTSGDKRIKYVIWNRRIWTPGVGWQAYKGSNPHDHHLHLSVVSVPSGYDSTVQWALGASGAVGSPITILPAPSPVEDDMFSDADRLALQQIRDVLGANGGLKTDTLQSVAYLVRDAQPRVKDIQAALTRVLPILEAGASVEQVQQAMEHLTDADVLRIARAANDEADRRDRERLNQPT